jgi:Opioid growth factor receptor (OGFr) conserved region
MSKLLDFYRDQGTDTEGRSLGELWGWNDDELEEVHDFIQWMFPLPEPSRFNPDAPLLTGDDIAEFRSDELLQSRLRTSFERILRFLGFSWAEDGSVVEGPNFADRVPEIWAYPNHSWLRITRILRSLCLLGLKSEAHSLFQRLEALYSERRFPITADTFGYWEAAVRCGE